MPSEPERQRGESRIPRWRSGSKKDAMRAEGWSPTRGTDS